MCPLGRDALPRVRDFLAAAISAALNVVVAPQLIPAQSPGATFLSVDPFADSSSYPVIPDHFRIAYSGLAISGLAILSGRRRPIKIWTEPSGFWISKLGGTVGAGPSGPMIVAPARMSDPGFNS